MAQDKPEAAKRWLEGLFKAVDRLEVFPRSGHLLPEAESFDYRQILYKSHRVIYRIEGEVVAILTVRRSKQLLDLSEVRGEGAG